MTKTTFQRAARTLCTIVALSLPIRTANAEIGMGWNRLAACPGERPPCKYPTEMKHIVKKGENLWDIARQYYGKIKEYSHYPTEIARFNHRKVSDYIYAGETLNIPRIGPLDEECCY